MLVSAPASAAGSNMPWEQPLNQILQSVEGPVAKILAVIIIIVTGLTLAFGDTSGGFRRLTVGANERIDAELGRLADWAGKTKDGSLSDLAVEPDPKVWTQVCSEAHICTSKTCGQDSNCFFQQARKRLLAADVIVINHTLLFMLLGAPIEQEERESGYLFPNDFIIFDEAHTIEQTASRQIGIGVSQYGLRATVQRLYNARTRKGLFTVTRDAAGVTLPGLPYVIVGHNQRIAWGFTNVGPTVTDVYIENFNPQGEYQTPSGWARPEHRQELIHIKGKPDVNVDVKITRHGPVITELIPGETLYIDGGYHIID